MSSLMKPASATESLSHWQMKRPSIAAASTGTCSSMRVVDIGHVCLYPVLVPEALNYQVVLHWIDAREAEEEADHRADGGAAAAGRQFVFVGVLEDFPQAKEEAGALARPHQLQLLQKAD